MENINLDKQNLLKLWTLSIDTLTSKVNNEVIESPLIDSFSIQLPSFLDEPIESSIQVFKLKGEKPKISIVINNYIEYASCDLTEDEFLTLSRQFIEKNDIIQLEIRNNLMKKTEKNLEILFKSI